MKKKILILGFLAVCFSSVFIAARAAAVAQLTTIEGNVSILRNAATKWRPARPGMPLKIGDQLYARKESFAEIVYANGAVLRMDENSKVTIESASKKKAKTRSGVGNVWVNMRKLVTSAGSEFELATPTATAAIRGTVFNATTNTDSSTDVAVYEGKVAVGPGTQAQKTPAQKQSPASTAPVEVPGPEEVPGPYEVSLEEWVKIVAGQQISVRADGKFAKQPFNMQQAATKDSFVKKNLALDKELEKKK